MRTFSTFVLLVIVLLAACGNGPVVVSAKTCEEKLLTTPDCTGALCTGQCKNIHGDGAVGKCNLSVECYCTFPC
ncbi:hypothetical protein SLE2022_223070 [Rubroshorea leprosula]|uniref:Defensin n=1 Tax=Rubroshorea leprosula TaxID=152421 RepID=A0AAV5IFV8_9ROSI|nr:hypothetical protein SLEP1_g9349 [Rubroshorea leprosula]